MSSHTTNLLDTPETSHDVLNDVASATAEAPWEPRPRRRGCCLVVGGLTLLLLAAFAPLFVGAGFAFSAARGLQRDVAEIKTSLASLDLDQAERGLASVKEELSVLRRGIAWTAWWRRAPWIGPQLQTLDDAVKAGDQIVEAARPLLAAAKTMKEAASSVNLSGMGADLGVPPHKSFRDLTKEEKRVILSRLQQTLPDLRETRDKLMIARDAWNRIPMDELASPVRSRLEPEAVRLFALNDALSQTVALLEIGIPLAGYPRSQTLLVLLQNADEMRPSGGFIGTIGLVSPDSGEIGHIDFGDVYALDRLTEGKWKETPPDPIKQHLGVKAWYLRDANWSPDVPQSAARVMDFFARERSVAGLTTTTVDGVVLLEPRFFEELLHLTGPIMVEGKRFDEKNFFDELEFDVEQGFLSSGVPAHQRKEIVSKIGDAVVDRLLGLPAARWPELLAIVTRALERKDAMVVTQDPSLLALLDARGWTGRVQAATQDELMIVDANLAALKTDGVMDKRVAYQLDLTDPSGPRATITLTYANTNRDFSWRYTRYRDYVRVYVPEGSELLSADGAMLNDRTKTGGRVVPGNVDVFRDLGKTVFGAFWAIEPGETRTLRLTYRLPSAKIHPESYTLLVQHQPGMNTRLTLDLHFGKKLVSASPAEDAEEHGDSQYRYQTTLDRNRTFEVRTAQ